MVFMVFRSDDCATPSPDSAQDQRVRLRALVNYLWLSLAVLGVASLVPWRVSYAAPGALVPGAWTVGISDSDVESPVPLDNANLRIGLCPSLLPIP
jgi:hypothetical protein